MNLFPTVIKLFYLFLRSTIYRTVILLIINLHRSSFLRVATNPSSGKNLYPPTEIDSIRRFIRLLKYLKPNSLKNERKKIS